MSRLKVFHGLVFASLWVSAALAQPEFRVYPSTEATQEGGPASVLIIQTDNERFQVRIPKGYVSRVHQIDQSIVFTSESGSSLITMTMSTNYPGHLPKMEDLRDQVAKQHPTASLVQNSMCITGAGTGLLFDLFQPVRGDLMMRMRDGYVSFAEGSFEFTLSCDAKEYDKNKLSYAWLLNSFQLQPVPAKKDS